MSLSHRDPAELQGATAVERLPEIVEATLKQTGVPGMSVAVVSDGGIIFAERFGVREAGTDLAVDADTVFQVASLSKSLSATAIAAAIGESEGKLGWQTPIHDLLPSFTLSDDVVTERATLGDAFSHQTGLPTGAGDDLEDLGYDRDEMLSRLNLLPLDTFRASYHYSNFGLTAGAEAVAASRGQSWEELMDELVFDPISMKSSSARHDDYVAHQDRALLHAKIDGEFVAAFDRDPDPQSPAGGASSTANDMALWMKVLLDRGVTTIDSEETEIADPEALLAAMSPQIVSSTSTRADQRPGHYGYGFNASPLVSGRMAVSHSGAFVLPVGDLVGEDRPASSAEPRDLGELTGTYQNAYFGAMQIERSSDGLAIKLGPKREMRIELAPWDGDVFIYALATENVPTGSLASGTFDRTGGKVTLTLETFDANGLGTWTKAQ